VIGKYKGTVDRTVQRLAEMIDAYDQGGSIGADGQK
jgi:hypothetical protein